MDLPVSPAWRPATLHLSLAVRRVRNVVTVSGDLDLSTAPRLTRVLARLGASARPLVLDVATLRFVDSSGWDAVRATNRRRVALGLAPVQVQGASARTGRVIALIEAAAYACPPSSPGLDRVIPRAG